MSLDLKATKVFEFEAGGSAGFTLVEVIAALAILSLSLTVLFSTLSDAMYNQQRARTVAEATALAQSLLASTGIESALHPGTNSGTLQGGYRWEVQSIPFGTLADRKAWPVNAYKLSIRIFADSAPEEPIIQLSTLRFVPEKSVK